MAKEHDPVEDLRERLVWEEGLPIVMLTKAEYFRLRALMSYEAYQASRAPVVTGHYGSDAQLLFHGIVIKVDSPGPDLEMAYGLSILANLLYLRKSNA